MRNIVLSAIALFLAVSARSQITLNSGSYPVSVIGTDSLKVTMAASTFPSFAAATNGSWDLSTVTDSMPVLYAYRVPTTSYEFADSNFYSLSTYGYQGNVQSSVVSSGLLEYGINIQEADYSLTAATLGSTDSLIIPAQDTIYSSPRVKLAFPAIYLSNWKSDYHFNLHIIISVALISLIDSPGVVTSYVTEKDSVIGWGKMRVKTLAGTPSGWFNVLQVKTIKRTVDSFFISGIPASVTLLSHLGLTQGQVTTSYDQNYYRQEEITPFANVQFTDSTYTTPSKITTHVQRTADLDVATTGAGGDVTICPNPVGGGEVTVSLPAMGGTWSYEVLTVNGRILSAEALNVAGTHAKIILPSIPAGICYIRFSNNGKEIAVKPINIVK